jgi:hypothetical protein
MRYDGTRATLRGTFNSKNSAIEIHDHLTGQKEHVYIPETDGTGHGGGDFGVVASFVRALHGEVTPLTNARAALESHLLAFAAEASRHQNIVINMNEFRRNAEN